MLFDVLMLGPGFGVSNIGPHAVMRGKSYRVPDVRSHANTMLGGHATKDVARAFQVRLTHNQRGVVDRHADSVLSGCS